MGTSICKCDKEKHIHFFFEFEHSGKIKKLYHGACGACSWNLFHIIFFPNIFNGIPRRHFVKLAPPPRLSGRKKSFPGLRVGSNTRDAPPCKLGVFHGRTCFLRWVMIFFSEYVALFCYLFELNFTVDLVPGTGGCASLKSSTVTTEGAVTGGRLRAVLLRSQECCWNNTQETRYNVGSKYDKFWKHHIGNSNHSYFVFLHGFLCIYNSWLEW